MFFLKNWKVLWFACMEEKTSEKKLVHPKVNYTDRTKGE
jgi:hypothetical protein